MVHSEIAGRSQNEKGGTWVAPRFCAAKSRSMGPRGIPFSVLTSLGPAISECIFIDAFVMTRHTD